ncbi:MAG: BCD family MFS transporter [Pseudomonadota bacterium]
MRHHEARFGRGFQIGPGLLPFADAASDELPLGRLLRLSLFQVTAGLAFVLLNGTLNRVMIVELGVPTWLVSLMISIPLVFAPLRALIGFRSDHHRSVLGWRRVPYIWMGTLLQFGGLAIMPFALILLSGDSTGPAVVGQLGAALAFLLVGAGLHTSQTAGLALANDLAPEESRPRVVALLYVMLLVGMVGSSLAFGALLTDFSQVKLIRVIQGAAVLSLVLNTVALGKQEARDPVRARARSAPRPGFASAWRSFVASGRSTRLLVVVGLGTVGFSMQDILLEPYGAQILGLSVAQTTSLTAILACGTLVALGWAAREMGRGTDPCRLAATGTLVGVIGFSAVIFAEPFQLPILFRSGTALIGFGGGLFGVGTLVAAMGLARDGASGLALGAWGAVQATAAGLGVALGGGLRDVIGSLAVDGALGPALAMQATGYSVVYHIEIALLFMTMAAIGPLVRSASASDRDLKEERGEFGLAEFPS